MKNLIAVASIVALLVLTHGTATAVTMSAEEIVSRANQASYYPGKDGRAQVKMTIIDKSGSSRSREFTILRMNLADENQKFYVYFRAPADVNKMAFLVWKNVGGSDDRWLWLPALNLNKRIAPGDKRTSFVGSDFYYEDVSGRGIHEDHHQLLEETAESYVIKSVPKKPEEVEFSWFKVMIDKKTFLPKKAEYYDRNNEIYREVEALEIKTVQGYPTVSVAEARDLKSGSSTRNEFSAVTFDLGLKERIFTERFLRRPPREIK
jgi:hypothetical protein